MLIRFGVYSRKGHTLVGDGANTNEFAPLPTGTTLICPTLFCPHVYALPGPSMAIE